MAQIQIDDEALIGRAQEEANRSSNGDLNALAAASLRYLLGVTDGVRWLEKQASVKKGRPEAETLAEAVGALDVSADRLTAVADVLLQAAGAAPTFKQPSSLYTYVGGHLEWARASPDHAVSCVVVSSQAAAGEPGSQRNGIIGFARGWLQARGRSLAGSLDQYFSDRTGPGGSPFNLAQMDRLGVNVSADETSGLVTIEFIAESWGGARQSVRDLRLQAGVISGLGDAVAHAAPSALYTVSFGTIAIPG